MTSFNEENPEINTFEQNNRAERLREMRERFGVVLGDQLKSLVRQKSFDKKQAREFRESDEYWNWKNNNLEIFKVLLDLIRAISEDSGYFYDYIIGPKPEVEEKFHDIAIEIENDCWAKVVGDLPEAVNEGGGDDEGDEVKKKKKSKKKKKGKKKGDEVKKKKKKGKKKGSEEEGEGLNSENEGRVREKKNRPTYDMKKKISEVKNIDDLLDIISDDVRRSKGLGITSFFEQSLEQMKGIKNDIDKGNQIEDGRVRKIINVYGLQTKLRALLKDANLWVGKKTVDQVIVGGEGGGNLNSGEENSGGDESGNEDEVNDEEGEGSDGEEEGGDSSAVPQSDGKNGVDAVDGEGKKKKDENGGEGIDKEVGGLSATGILKLAKDYLDGENGKKKDEVRGAAMIERAAKKGNASANYVYARFLIQGLFRVGVDKDRAKEMMKVAINGGLGQIDPKDPEIKVVWDEAKSELEVKKNGRDKNGSRKKGQSGGDSSVVHQNDGKNGGDAGNGEGKKKKSKKNADETIKFNFKKVENKITELIESKNFKRLYLLDNLKTLLSARINGLDLSLEDIHNNRRLSFVTEVFKKVTSEKLKGVRLTQEEKRKVDEVILKKMDEKFGEFVEKFIEVSESLLEAVPDVENIGRFKEMRSGIYKKFSKKRGGYNGSSDELIDEIVRTGTFRRRLNGFITSAVDRMNESNLKNLIEAINEKLKTQVKELVDGLGLKKDDLLYDLIDLLVKKKFINAVKEYINEVEEGNDETVQGGDGDSEGSGDAGGVNIGKQGNKKGKEKKTMRREVDLEFYKDQERIGEIRSAILAFMTRENKENYIEKFKEAIEVGELREVILDYVKSSRKVWDGEEVENWFGGFIRSDDYHDFLTKKKDEDEDFKRALYDLQGIIENSGNGEETEDQKLERIGQEMFVVDLAILKGMKKEIWTDEFVGRVGDEVAPQNGEVSGANSAREVEEGDKKVDVNNRKVPKKNERERKKVAKLIEDFVALYKTELVEYLMERKGELNLDLPGKEITDGKKSDWDKFNYDLVKEWLEDGEGKALMPTFEPSVELIEKEKEITENGGAENLTKAKGNVNAITKELKKRILEEMRKALPKKSSEE